MVFLRIVVPNSPMGPLYSFQSTKYTVCKKTVSTLSAKLNSQTKWCRRHASNWLQDSWISRRFMQILSLLKVHSLQLQVFDLKWPTERENIERIRTEISLTIFCAKMQTFIGSEKKENGENGSSFLTTQNHLFFDCQWVFCPWLYSLVLRWN